MAQGEAGEPTSTAESEQRSGRWLCGWVKTVGGKWGTGGRRSADGAQPTHRPQRVQRVELRQHVAPGGQARQGGATHAPATHGEACARGREGGLGGG